MRSTTFDNISTGTTHEQAHLYGAIYKDSYHAALTAWAHHVQRLATPWRLIGFSVRPILHNELPEIQ